MSTLMSGAKRAELGNGQVVYVRRMRNSEIAKVANAAGEVNGRGMLAVQTLMGELTMRLCIVGADNLKDAATGEPVAFKTERHPVLGVIASTAVYDALDGEGMKAVQDAMGESEKAKEASDDAGKP